MNFDHLDPDEVYTSAQPIPVALLRAAWQWAQDRSKDPYCKIGAVVYHPESGASFFGYNGFNAGMPDYKALWDCKDRDSALNKFNFVRHAEANAISKAERLVGDMSSCYLVVTHLPCPACMKDFIAPSGIKRVYYNDPDKNHPLTWIHAKAHEISFVQIESPGVGKFYSDKLGEAWVPPDPARTEKVNPQPAEPPQAMHPDRKTLWIEPHALDQLRERFPDEISGDDHDLRRLLFGMFYNGSEVGERVVSTSFVRVAYFKSGRGIALSCKDEGHRFAIVTVLYPEELHTTGLIRLPENP